MRKLILTSTLLATAWMVRPGAAAPQAIGFDGALPDFTNVDVESSHVYDYTFTSAPVDWRLPLE